MSKVGNGPTPSPKGAADADDVGAEPRAEASVTVHSTGFEARAAAASGRVSDGVDVEIGSVRLEWSGQNFVAQGALHQATVDAGRGFTLSTEAFSFKVNSGNMGRNADGSIGANRGAQVTIVGGDVTYAKGGFSATLGASAGAGNDFSVGVRDRDGDGNNELCVRGSAWIGTLGLCVELPGK